MSISACIVCRNEADRLVECLQSVTWVDDVIVMDLSSTDDSRAVAERHGARVITRERVPVVEMVRNEIASAALHDWILVLDPDERVTPGLAAELTSVSSRNEIDAVVVPRMNIDLGYPPSNPQHRYEPQLRMYRRSRVVWPTFPNALPVVPRELTHFVQNRDELVLIHDRSRNIPEILDRAIRYAPIQAKAMYDAGTVFSARAMFMTLSRAAWKELVLGQAWRDGVPGILRAGLLLNFKFWVWTALWQVSGAKKTPEDDRFVRRSGAFFESLRRGWSGARMMRQVAKAIARRG